MQSHKWLHAHENPLTEPVGSAASMATRRANAEQSALSQKNLESKKSLPGVVTSRDTARKVAESRKRVERVRGQLRESARTKLQREDWAQRPQPKRLPA